MARKTLPRGQLPIRTLADLKKRTVEDPVTGCWVWQGYVLPCGYALTSVRGRRMSFHRAAFLLSRGVDAEKVVRHTCDNRACGNPEHLLGGSSSDNRRDAMTRGRVGLLTFEVARFIRESSATQVCLAKQFGVSRRAVRNVLSGRSWKEEVRHR